MVKSSNNLQDESNNNPDYEAEIDNETQDFIDKLATDPDAVVAAHKQAAAKLLHISMNYCEVFVPAQLKEIEEHIKGVNTRIRGGKDPNGQTAMTSALLSLLKAHSEMMERGPIIFMANTRPLMKLLASGHFDQETAGASDAADYDPSEYDPEGIGEYDELDDIDLSTLHKPYDDSED